jgi:DNA-nicking Smr family endonuclease
VRSLDPDEAELWARVAATIQPLSREKPFAGQRPSATAVTPRPPKQATAVAPRTPAKPPATPIASKTLDGSWDKKLRSGDVEPDRVLDLHGMNLDTAWAAIDSSLERAIARGERLILLVTGHHRAGDPPVQRGRIRAAVHDWLAASRHADRIAAVRGAHRRHGGGGSLYLILRRKMSGR